ncbi:Nitrate transport protein NrtA precursor [Phaeobacter sp. CECT 5382]|uniref:CmpA/NrtA family ABC transporter substrate-binding protein n=1 Tax=Phaeobacter sp. CECT 5382 TaxID=1712645 RepID=UPI0006DA21A8|nr:CmpA/NrtA family ABC transporter substrate-binding protein [Phaeobacter sp. CECT 5382]CUH88553.1 Nitrate transport protein NrtA precursor [Phaeobacter sp. CECT 5382]
MTHTVLPVGFVPLVDAAPLIVAQEMGFAAEEKLTLDLRPAPSWSLLRDMLAFGQVDAAHMLSPLPVATALGMAGAGCEFSVLSVLSINGNVIGVSTELAAKITDQGHGFTFDDARAAGHALLSASNAPLRIGVPFPFSMHAELLYYWLNALGFAAPNAVDIRTVPPSLMADAISAGEIDAFCVGEPWGSIAVEQGVGSLLLPSQAIWSFAPEKVLAVRRDWPEENAALAARLIRAIWRAGRWLADPSSRLLAAELMSSRRYLDLPPEILERALSGNLTITPQGRQRAVPGFLEFHNGAAGFPWRSQAQWIAQQIASRNGFDRKTAAAAGRQVFRSDLYREALKGTQADLPGASLKFEGALEVETPVASKAGTLSLLPNRFFDRQVFDPSDTS